jgi:hypothetical protein
VNREAAGVDTRGTEPDQEAIVSQGSITAEDTTFVETWENVSPITNWVIRLDVRGEDKPEPVQGARQFLLTTAERLLTSSRIADVRNDPFANGCFRPVIVPSTIDVKTNPNALSDSDIERILGSSAMAWEGYLEAVDSPATLRRMVETADRMVADGQDLSMRRYRQLEERLQQVAPRKRVTQRDAAEYEKLADAPARKSMKRR